MPHAIRVSGDVIVPAHALSVRVSRSSGPGGQNVNKVSSKVELRVDLDGIEGLSDDARARLRERVRRKVDSSGSLVVRSQRNRDQHRNLGDARDKVRELIAMALVEPKERRPTEPTRAARERRLTGKRRSSDARRTRAAVRAVDEDGD